MAWSISEYSGLKANGTDSRWRLAMFELCRAVNQRQFGAKTEFFKGDGTQGSDITYEEMFGLNSSVSQCGVNLGRIQGAIVAMCPYFTQTSGGDDFWTKPLLESAIGESLSEGPTGPLDSRFWRAQQLALDRLLYTQATGDASIVSGAGLGSRSYFQDMAWFPNTADEAWGDLGYNSGPLTYPQTQWSMSGPGSAFFIYYAGASSGAVASVALSPEIPPVIVKIKYYVIIVNDTKIVSAGPIEPGYHVGSAAGTVTWASSPYYRTVEIETLSNDFSSGNEVSISMDDGIPASNPIPPFASGSNELYNSPSIVLARLDRAKAYYDLTPLLSDQT